MKHSALRKQPIYPFDDWQIVETAFDIQTNHRDETVFAVGNGYIGMRGNFEEGYDGPSGTSLQGTYLNGFYESEPIRYGEEAHAYAKHSQTMLNVTDSKIIRLIIDGEPFHLFAGKVLAYRRTLDMKTGIMSRDLTWESPSGKQVNVRIRRMACLQHRHLLAISYEVLALNFSGEIILQSVLDGAVQNQITMGDPRVGSSFSGQVLMTEAVHIAESFAAIQQKTRRTQFALVCAMENALHTMSPVQWETVKADQGAEFHVRVSAQASESVRLEKFIAYYTSKDDPEGELLGLAKTEVERAKQVGFDELAVEQRAFLDGYWAQSDVEIHGDAALQQSLRFNAFHLLQSAGRDGKTNIGAKGITGEGYEGHYFWDTETYIFPFFLFTHPSIARKLLEYRYHILDKARERARELSQVGALYAWRTIDGEETSPYFPAGTAAYHVNADVIYALKTYMHATDDLSFLLSCGAEMLFETARFWVDLGDYIPHQGNRFCINEVTGPDEYTAMVNNNLYTNVMVKDHLEYAASTAQLLRAEHPDEYRSLAAKIGLRDEEILEWDRAARLMYLPYDEELGIHPQDDSFLNKAVWDFAHTPEQNYPLLLHYHPLVIYRYQVLKQADVVLALYLQGDRFSLAEKKRDFDYYEAITTHDSSLSPCIHSIVAAEIGYLDKAYDYFMQTARMDLDDYNDNVKDGIHTASMAGTWLAIVHGFGGMRDFGGQLSFRPVIPDKWDKYRFRVAFKGRRIAAEVSHEAVTYTLASGDPIKLLHNGEPILLERSIRVKMA